MRERRWAAIAAVVVACVAAWGALYGWLATRPVVLALEGAPGVATRPVVLALEGAPGLANPGLEEGFYLHGGVGEVEIGTGWLPWHDGQYHRPEYKPETLTVGKARVRSGAYAQKLFTTYAAHDAGVYQVVEGVTPGAWYTFSMWGYQWSSQQDDPDRSVDAGKCSVLVGINPWGDERALYRTTVWGKEALAVYNEWVQVSVTAEAWGDKIVVFARQMCEWPVRHNDAYLDDAALAQVAIGGEVTPAPTYTPYPTYTPAATAQPGAIDYDRIRTIVREEIDSTGLVGRASP